jgi:hypothetical protein
VLPLGGFTLIAGRRRWKFSSGLLCLVLLVHLSGLVGCGKNGVANDASTSDAVGVGTTQLAPVTTVLTLSGVSGTQTRTVGLTLTVQ